MVTVDDMKQIYDIDNHPKILEGEFKSAEEKEALKCELLEEFMSTWDGEVYSIFNFLSYVHNLN